MWDKEDARLKKEREDLEKKKEERLERLETEN